MVKPLASGIYGIIGAPGSGKSFKAVKEIIRYACKTPRPIYTNVPIVPKKLRAMVYVKLPRRVKGHTARRARANLVKSISQRHFQAFCTRLAKIDAQAELVMDEWGLDRGAIGELAEFRTIEARNEAMRRVSEQDGEAQITGRNADWIPLGSILFLDELHKWYPSRNYKDEPEEILAFTSMHRHCQLLVFVMTQRWMNASLSFRSMAKEVWYCMNWARKPVLGFLRFDKYLNIFRYVHYLGEDIEERSGLPRLGAKPVWSEMVCPEMSGAPEFDCYRSFSHAGSLEEQQEQITAITREMMGEEATKKIQETEDKAMARKRHVGKKLNGWLTIFMICGGTFFLGRCTAPPIEVIRERTVEVDADQADGVAGPTAATTGQAGNQPGTNTTTTNIAQEPPAWVSQRVNGISLSGVQVNGQQIQLGQRYQSDLLLVAVDPTLGVSIWLGPQSVVYHWNVGRVPVVGVLPPDVREQLLAGVRSAAATDQPAGASTTPDGDDAP